MTARAKSPATRDATDAHDDVQTPEDRHTATDPEPEQAPEPDSHEDLVARVRRLETRIF